MISLPSLMAEVEGFASREYDGIANLRASRIVDVSLYAKQGWQATKGEKIKGVHIV